MIYGVLFAIFSALSTSEKHNDYPYLASLENKGKNVHLCSGVIMSLTKVLTTCKCIVEVVPGSQIGIGLNESDYIVRAGVDFLHEVGEVREVGRFSHHENCRQSSDGHWSFDYGIVEFSGFPIGERIRLVLIVSDLSSKFLQEVRRLWEKDAKCELAGWKNDSRLDNPKERMIIVHNVQLMNKDKCVVALCKAKHQYCHVELEMYGQVCGQLDYPTDHLDLGGPLVCKTTDNFVWGILNSVHQNLALFSTLEPALPYFQDHAKSVSSSLYDFTPYIFFMLLNLF